MELMEIGLFILFIVLAFVAMIGLAGLTRIILVKIAKRNGYTADEMPLVYHLVAVGAYFSILFLVLAVGAYT